ncbi:MAG: glycoside hydrolase, partial [Bacteroidota bacterium]
YDKSWYDYILTLVGDKPIAIGECSILPSREVLANQPNWTFFMSWAELVKEKNSEETIWDTYVHSRVLTLDELPGWN